MNRDRRVALLVGAVLAVAVAGCDGAGAPRTAPTAAPASASAAGFNDTDVMFLQMSLEHVRQGRDVVRLAEQRGRTTEVRELAAAMHAQWADESDTMARWLTAWGQPLVPAADAGLHAGHGDLHSLRPADIAELRASSDADFDRTAISLLVGHLHNSVEVTRLEATGGAYPPARDLAATMTKTRMAQIQQMLRLLA